MIHNPYIAGTFWRTAGGRTWLIGPAERWTSMDAHTLGNIRQLTPDLVGAVQLRLVPVDAVPAPPERPAPLPDPVVQDESKPLGWLFRNNQKKAGEHRG